MLRSMTGYGRGQAVVDLWDITVEVRAVNHRFFEFSSRLPKTCLFLEDKLKNLVQSGCSRGKVELYCSVQSVGQRDTEVQVNEDVAQSYLAALRDAAPRLGLQDNLQLTDLFRLPEIFTLRRAEVDEDRLWAAVESVAKTAMASFVSMREVEGERLKADVSGRLDTIAELLASIEERAPMLRQEYYDRLYQKIKEILADKTVDEGRLITEAAVFADRVAIDEETVRLHSHLQQFHALLDSDEPVGRKLDFLVQEVNRETNTIGSKCQDVSIARKVVDIKAEIEKIREQIQNME